MQNTKNNSMVVELNNSELDHVDGAGFFVPLLIAGARAAITSSAGKKIAAGAFATAVAIATSVSGGDSE